VLRLIGEGGMGVVFEAEDSRLKRKVALKVMRPEAAGHPQGRARFLREAEAVAALSHDHIIPIHDIGEDNGVLFFVLPLLRGESLQERLARRSPLPVAEAVRIAREMAEGLAAAHAAGLIHRDVKPANVWLEAPEGRVKLLDFGLALLEAGGVRLTRVGAVLGTPAYMAPERLGGKADQRADLFSLGAVLYEMLTGRRPFRGEAALEALAAVLRERPPAPAEINGAVPQPLSALVLALLEREPQRRPASARQVVGLLARGGDQPLAVPLPLPGRRPSAGRRRWALPAFALALAALIAATAFVWRPVGSTRDESPQDRSSPRPSPSAADLVSMATAFADALHDQARADLCRRGGREKTPAALAFATACHEAASGDLARQQRDRVAEQASRQRREARLSAAMAFGTTLHEAAEQSAR
jgi:serine/threonine protein kinase